MQETSEHRGQQASTDPFGGETLTRDYLMVLWKRKWLVLSVSLLCGLVALAVSKTSSPIYEASVKMVLSAPRTGDTAPALSLPVVRAIVENQTLAAQIVKEFHLDGEPTRLSPQQLLSNLVIETPRDTNAVVVRVRLASRDLPAKVANRLAELASDLAQRLSQDETVRNHDYVKAQLEQSIGRLDAIDARWGDFRRKAQIEALKKDVEAELDQRAGLLPLEMKIASERASLVGAEAELAKRQPTGTIRRTIDNDPALMEAAKESLKPNSSVLGLEVKNEYRNRVYEELDRGIAESRMRLSALERQKAELVSTRKLASGQLEKLNLLYSREAELERLSTERDLAKKTYLDVATRYEQIRLQGAGRGPQLQVLDAAIPPDRPITPRVLRNTVVATFGGFILAALAALLLAVVVPRETQEALTRRGHSVQA